MKGTVIRPVVAVVDDDPDVRSALERLLLSMGFDPRPFDSAEAFLSESGPDEFDCLLLDVQLGGMSGIELGHHLAATRIDLPIIMLTANADAVVQEELDAQLAVAVLMKPARAEVLRAALEAAIGVAALA